MKKISDHEDKREKDSVIKSLCQLAAVGELAHSILLETEDISKKGLKSALCIAKTLLCHKKGTSPCNTCIACRKIDLGVHPDVKIVSAKPGYKAIRVDDIREIRLDAYLSPNESENKVYIISDGGVINEQAQNVFLKILEEPPQNVKFIIICESKFLMLPTIRSRTQIFELGDEHTAKLSAKIKETIHKILSATAKGNDFAILTATSELVKNKETFGKIIKELYYIVSDICIKRAKNENLQNYPEFNNVSMKKILKIREGIMEIKDMLTKNVNIQLVACELCIKLGGN